MERSAKDSFITTTTQGGSSFHWSTAAVRLSCAPMVWSYSDAYLSSIDSASSLE